MSMSFSLSLPLPPCDGLGGFLELLLPLMQQPSGMGTTDWWPMGHHHHAHFVHRSLVTFLCATVECLTVGQTSTLQAN